MRQTIDDIITRVKAKKNKTSFKERYTDNIRQDRKILKFIILALLVFLVVIGVVFAIIIGNM